MRRISLNAYRYGRSGVETHDDASRSLGLAVALVTALSHHERGRMNGDISGELGLFGQTSFGSRGS
jgi:hypothetical protein